MYVICRTFNNWRFQELVKDLISIEEITGLIVVINIDRDNRPNETQVPFDTLQYLHNLNCSKLIRSIPLSNAQFGWSKALNAALALIPVSEDYVAVMSSEVSLTSIEFHELTSAASLPKASCGYALYADRYEPTYLLPRNTCIVWKRAVFDHERCRQFDVNLDQSDANQDYGGMEDVDLVYRCYEFQGLLPFVGPTAVKLAQRLTEPEFERKIANEETAVETIQKSYRSHTVQAVIDHMRKDQTRKRL